MKDQRALVGSLLAGLLASACCIGPLLLGALGLGSLGFAVALAPLRPWFIGLAGALLAVGFYFAYRPERAEACASGQACAKAASRRTPRLALWLVAVLVMALVTYPSWSARLTSRRGPASRPPVPGSLVLIDVQGMTCEGCEAEIEGELVKVPGVLSATVSFERKRAEVRVANPAPELEPLLAAVEKAGYRAAVEHER